MYACAAPEVLKMQKHVQAHKLGVVLLDKMYVLAQRTSLLDPLANPLYDAKLATGKACPSWAMLRQDQGIPSKCGTRMQLLSSAVWNHLEQSGNAVPLRFWLHKARLQAMINAGWHAYVITTDTWHSCTPDATPLKDGCIVRELVL